MTERPGTVWTADDRALWLRRLVAGSALVLMVATWRLWTPQDVFPQVPLVSFAGRVPDGSQWLLLAINVAALLIAIATPRTSVWGSRTLVVFAVCLPAMMAIDQHRIQPWAYQFALLAIALAWCDSAKALRLVAALTVSIYIYSALSKFDYAFLHTLGQQFVSALAGSVGQSIQDWPPGARLVAAGTIPIGELFVAVGLCFQRSRRWALYASIVMHVLLIVALGPLGLHHKPAVLIWNAYFIAQNILLFGGSRSASETEITSPTHRWMAHAATAKFVAAMLLPLGVSWGLWDEWPSWGLYSARAERVGLFVRREAVDEVPVDLRRFLRDADPDDPWMQLHLDRWSLETLDAPLYPQARFQLGVAAAVVADSDFRHFQIITASAADRLTGKREQRDITNPAELTAASESYWLNALPR